jgi:hypothetical protein
MPLPLFFLEASMAFTRTQCLERLAWMTASDQYPTLDSTALQQLIDDALRYTTWTASTAYNVGDMIVPPVPNGRVYRCVIAGISGTDSTIFPIYATKPGYTLYDGSGNPGLTWQDYAFANAEPYDLHLAVRNGWLRKAAACATQIAIEDGNVKADMEKLQAHCLSQAQRHQPLGIV